MEEEHILELSLLDNGLDFILRGLDELYDMPNDIDMYPDIYPASEPHKDYKYGVLHLFSGFLLLLKERLSRHMPELIFEGKIDEIRKKQNSGKEMNTVNLDEALQRLEIGPKVVFSESDTKLIRKIQRYRNTFEHYKLSENTFELKKSIICFIDLIDRFLINELKIDMTSGSVNRNNLIRDKVLSIESIHKRLLTEWRREIAGTGEKKVKKFRRNKKAILDELDSEVYRNKGSIEVTDECPECGEFSLIIYGEYEGVCHNCYSYSSLTSCNRCGKTMIGYRWENELCNICIEEIQELLDKED